MARDGAGTYNRVHDWTQDRDNSINITASRMDEEFDDIATALTGSIAKDGQTTTTARIPFAQGIKTDTVDENTSGTGVTIDGVLLKDGRIDTARATGIASAATTSIGAATGNFVHITGTTTITSFGTAAAGVWRFLVFDGVLTLTHNATSLILPGGANITTTAGDCCLAMSEGSGNWRVLWYTRADGSIISDLVAPGQVRLTGRIDISLTADQDDWSPTGLSGAAVIRASGDAARTITGLSGGASGREIALLNVGSFPLTLAAESASSTAGNRFGFSADMTLQSGDGVRLIYDSVSSRWRLSGRGGAFEPLGQSSGTNAQTGTSYTLVLGDAGKVVTLDNVAAITLTVPPNSTVAFPTGTVIHLVQLGAGQVTVSPGVGVTVNARGSRLKIAGQYGWAMLWKRDSDIWQLTGDLVS